MKYVAFDIEIAEPFPVQGEPDHSKLGISCAATRTSEGEYAIWHGPEQPDGTLAPRLNKVTAFALARSLYELSQAKYRVITWNGLFDFRVLYHECAGDPVLQENCKTLALAQIDPMFQFLTETGYCIGLEKTAIAMLHRRKVGMHGADAPVLWKEGREKQEAVLTYVKGDVDLTASVYRAITNQGGVRWLTSRGGIGHHTFKDRALLSVAQCLERPAEDARSWWPDCPFDRAKMVEWLDTPVINVV